jgi:hypothetical protein
MDNESVDVQISDNRMEHLAQQVYQDRPRQYEESAEDAQGMRTEYSK